jgi:hypothetical protein
LAAWLEVRRWSGGIKTDAGDGATLAHRPELFEAALPTRNVDGDTVPFLAQPEQ